MNRKELNVSTLIRKFLSTEPRKWPTRLSLMIGTSNFDITLDGIPESIENNVTEKIENNIDIIGSECAVLHNAPYVYENAGFEQVKKKAC